MSRTSGPWIGDQGLDVLLLVGEVVDPVRLLRLDRRGGELGVLGEQGEREVGRADDVGQDRGEELVERLEVAAEVDRLGEWDIRQDREVLGADLPPLGELPAQRIGIGRGEPAGRLAFGERRGQLAAVEVLDPVLLDPSEGPMEDVSRRQLLHRERRGPAAVVGDVAEEPVGLGVIGVAGDDGAEAFVGQRQAGRAGLQRLRGEVEECPGRVEPDLPQSLRPRLPGRRDDLAERDEPRRAVGGRGRLAEGADLRGCVAAEPGGEVVEGLRLLRPDRVALGAEVGRGGRQGQDEEGDDGRRAGHGFDLARTIGREGAPPRSGDARPEPSIHSTVPARPPQRRSGWTSSGFRRMIRRDGTPGRIAPGSDESSAPLTPHPVPPQRGRVFLVPSPLAGEG